MKKCQIACLFAAFLMAASPPGESQQRRVFVTSVSGTGDLGSWPDAGAATGIAAADAICQARALVGPLSNPGNFVAWISDSNDDAYCRLHGLGGKVANDCGQPALPSAAGPWVRTDPTDGLPFSEAIDQLIGPSGLVYMPLRYDEFGQSVLSAEVFTATDTTGELIPIPPMPCSDWFAATPGQPVVLGTTRWTTGQWSSIIAGECDQFFRLFCFERFSGPALGSFAIEGP